MTSKEALEFFVKNIDCDVYEFDLDEVIKHKRCLEQDLDRLEELEKAIENSNKAYDVLMQNSNIQFLNQNQEIFKLKKVIDILKKQKEGQTISQEEYDLLKEYL